MRVRASHSAVDELVAQQSAHHVGAEVDNVLDLPEGLLRRLKRTRGHTSHAARVHNANTSKLAFRSSCRTCHQRLAITHNDEFAHILTQKISLFRRC